MSKSTLGWLILIASLVLGVLAGIIGASAGQMAFWSLWIIGLALLGVFLFRSDEFDSAPAAPAPAPAPEPTATDDPGAPDHA